MTRSNTPPSSWAGRYRRLEELGAGGMATVYRAQDVHRNRDVAIKIFDPVIASVVGEDRFLLETQIVSDLEHPNIVPILDSGSSDGLLFFVMPVLSGETLAQRIERDGPLSLKAVSEIIDGVAAALQHAHTSEVIHRDIKPANIMLTDGGPIVLDFGIAKVVGEVPEERLTKTGIVVGTAPYTSPEQGAAVRQLDGRSDQYSLACVAYEMLVGEPPFTGVNAQVIAARHAFERPPNVSVVRPDLPVGVGETLAKALAKAPADRFENVEEFARALASPRPGKAPRPSPSGEERQWTWRRPALAAALSALVLLTLVQVIPRRPPLEATRVVGFPLVDVGIRDSGSISGTDVGLLLGVALEQAYPLRWQDGWRWMNPAERADPTNLRAGDARRIAREQGAARYIDGVVQHTPDSIRVILRLWDTAADSLIRQASEGAAVGSFGARAALRAFVRLIPQLVDPGRAVDLAHLLDREPAAVASWLEGEREYRNSRFEEALTAYQDALEADALLTPAALKGAQAANWLEQPQLAAQLIDQALNDEGTLPPPELALARGIRSYVAGDFLSADSALALAIELDSTRSEMWMARAELYNHLVAPLGSDFDAVSGFERASRLDPDFLPPLIHLAERAALDGDIARVEEIASRIAPSDPDSTFLGELSLLRECMNGEDVDWTMEAETSLLAVREASRALLVGGTLPECGEMAARAVMNHPDAPPSDQWGAVKLLHGLLMAQGRVMEAAALADSVFDGGVPQAGLLHLLAAAQGAELDGRDDRFMELLVQILEGQYGPQYRSSALPGTLWIMGIWHAARGDVDEVAAIEEGLHRMAADTGDRLAELAGQAMLGWRLLITGDSASAAATFESLVPVTEPRDLAWEPVFALGAERLALSRLLMDGGEHERALEVASTFDHRQPLDYLRFMGESLALRARAAESLGRSDRAEEYRARLERLTLAPQDIPSQGGSMWVYAVLGLLVLCCIWHMIQLAEIKKQLDDLETGDDLGANGDLEARVAKVETWITENEPWLIAHHERHEPLEKAVCNLEDKVFDNVGPDPALRFCPDGPPPDDGWGGSAPADGF